MESPSGKRLAWQIEEATAGIAAILPGMASDIVLEHAADERRVIIDTKFTSVFGKSQHRAAVLKSGYIYQLYTYLRSQERTDDRLSITAAGIFIHPSVEGDLDETVRIQGHDLRFATVDLTQPSSAVLRRLRALVPHAT